MAHRSTNSSNRRNLAAPEAKPLGSAPQLKRLPKPTSQLTTQSSDPLILPSKKPFFLTNQFSRLNLNHKIRTPQKPTTNNQHNRLLPPASSRDIHLQAKAMTVSADAADSFMFSLIRAKASLKEKVRKGSSKDLDKKKEQQQQHHHHYHQHRRSEPDSKKITTLAAMKEKQVNNNNNLHDMKAASGSLGRRRSFCGSQVELADILANCGVKIVSVDMPPFMQIHAVDCARKTHDSLEKFTSKTLALTLKKEFDGVYGPAWHCIVGTSFGSFVTHSVGGFLYFSMDHKLYVLLFKTTVQRAD